MTQLHHITDPETWRQSRAAGEYAMSTRGVTLAEQFPHIYGPLGASAVIKSVLVSRDATGQLSLPPWLESA